MASEPSWLTNEFIEKILKQSENDDSIRVLNLITKPATNKGDNYMSQMHRTTVNYTRNQGPRQVTEKKSLVIKAILPEGPQHDLIKEIGLFDVEIRMMTTTLRDMQRLLNDAKLSGKCLHTQYDNPLAMLVIEDLAPLGFRMADREAGLDLQHCMLAIRGLAKFHASSVAVCEKIPKYKEQYTRGIFNSANPAEFQKCFVGAMKTLGNAIETWPELDKQYADKIRNISEKAYGQASEASIVDNSEFNVINHGDYWVNNMLFRYDDNGKVIDHIFVDFQLCLYGSPAIDLTYFLNTSPSEEVLKNHSSTLIEEYLKVLSETMKRIGCKTVAPSMTDLKRSMHKKEVYGFVAACTILPIVLVNKDDAQDLEEIMNSGETGEVNNKAYTNEAYIKTMSRRLPYWNELGLFEV